MFAVPLMGMTGTLHETIYPARAHRFMAEFYANPDYRPDGSLIVTREHAAVEMNISQSAVTAATQGLETQLDVRLLGRSSSGVAVTPEGARLLHHARAIVTAVQDAMRSPLGMGARVSGRARMWMTSFMPGPVKTAVDQTHSRSCATKEDTIRPPPLPAMNGVAGSGSLLPREPPNS